MKRRSFITSTLTAGIPAFHLASCGNKKDTAGTARNTSESILPATLAGKTIEELRDDYHHRFFDRYLPFWDRGGIDESGAIFCNLNDDGTVYNDEVFNWYQGRAIWVYSFLYNNFGKNSRYIEIARKARNFLVKNLYAGNGKWYEKSNRNGNIIEGVSDVIYGWIIVATGLQEYYKAVGNDEDLNLAIESLRAALKTYDNPDYTGSQNWGGYSSDIPRKGIRDQGYHMVFIRLLTQLLSHYSDPWLEELAGKQVDLLMNKFFNAEYGISNENLNHDYSRIKGYEDYMYIGHSLETQWMVMFEAIRTKDRMLFDTCKNNIRRNLELCWDYIFEGYGGDGHFYVFDGPERTREKMYNEKSMWSHTEILIATLTVLEYTGESWARDFYERTYTYAINKFDTPYGVWRQGVNRFGEEMKRDVNKIMGITNKRKGNFHMPRAFMLNMLSLNRMIKNRRCLTAFPV